MRRRIAELLHLGALLALVHGRWLSDVWRDLVMPTVLRAEYGFETEPPPGRSFCWSSCSVMDVVQMTLCQYDARGAARCDARAIVAGYGEAGAHDLATLHQMMSETPREDGRGWNLLRYKTKDAATPAYLSLLFVFLINHLGDLR